MDFDVIKVERTDDVAVIRLNDPATLNALTPFMIEEMNCALDDIIGKTRALIISGVGKAFSSGAGMATGLQHGGGAEPDYGIALDTHVNPLMNRLRDLPIPWISAVRGPAAGVSCSLALAADLIVASETGYFLQAFARIGLVPDGGSSYLLSRAVGRVRAMEMMLLGEKLPAAQALEWGLINRVVPDDQLDDVAMDIARKLAAGPTFAFSMIRRNAWATLDNDWASTLRIEREAQRLASRSADAAEGIAAFFDKRAARFEGR